VTREKQDIGKANDHESLLQSEGEFIPTSSLADRGFNQLYWIGKTNIALTSDPQASEVLSQFELFINCSDVDVLGEQRQAASTYLHLPLPQGKRDKQNVIGVLCKALPLAYQCLSQAKPLLIMNQRSLAIAGFLCVAILLHHFHGAHWEIQQKENNHTTQVNKALIKNALVFVSAQAPMGKGPPRALMKELNKFHMSTVVGGQL